MCMNPLPSTQTELPTAETEVRMVLQRMPPSVDPRWHHKFTEKFPSVGAAEECRIRFFGDDFKGHIEAADGRVLKRFV